MTVHDVSDLSERLLRRVAVNAVTACWEWTGYKINDGYGRLYDSATKKKQLAHRLAYEELLGPVPAGLQLDHLCRNRACINPAHLEPVTHWENTRRSPIHFAAICARKTHCVHGHEFTPENTRIEVRADGRRHRKCRECGRLKDARRTERRRAAAKAAA